MEQNQLITTRQCADQLGISVRRVSRLCEDGRIKGAFKPGQGKTIPWMIPASTADPRKPIGYPKDRPRNKKNGQDASTPATG